MQRIERDKWPLVVNISNRHWHCTKETFEKLFGEGAQPTPIRNLIQPGQFACRETVTLRGTKGEIKKVRMIGPFRAYDQIELSRTDCHALGIDAPVRDSGNVKGSAPITLVGPKGEARLPEGAIIQMRHIHFHTSEAEKYGVKNMETVKVRVGAPPRDGTITVLCRVREDMKLECHLDTDEGNSFNVKNGDLVTIL
ncbi:MAG: phosphate propanoyltransferase [Elusimicrobia bacterium]|nr:phosphate propanoyltransferase [Elusimicrobiota bacterium]